MKQALYGNDEIEGEGSGVIPQLSWARLHDANAVGYMLIIGDQFDRDRPIFVGYAPENGVGDLCQRVQFGNPNHLVILHFFAATPADVAGQKKSLASWQCRTDDNCWFVHSPEVKAYIKRLREECALLAAKNDDGIIARAKPARAAKANRQSKRYRQQRRKGIRRARR